MRSGGEPFANQDNDARCNTRQAGRQFEVVHSPKAAARFSGLVMPGNAEQVARVNIPAAPMRARSSLTFDGIRVGSLHLGEGRDDDITLASALNGTRAAGLIRVRSIFIINSPLVALLLQYTTACLWPHHIICQCIRLEYRCRSTAHPQKRQHGDQRGSLAKGEALRTSHSRITATTGMTRIASVAAIKPM